jgi:hypothetical protein
MPPRARSPHQPEQPCHPPLGRRPPGRRLYSSHAPAGAPRTWQYKGAAAQHTAASARCELIKLQPEARGGACIPAVRSAHPGAGPAPLRKRAMPPANVSSRCSGAAARGVWTRRGSHAARAPPKGVQWMDQKAPEKTIPSAVKNTHRPPHHPGGRRTNNCRAGMFSPGTASRLSTKGIVGRPKGTKCCRPAETTGPTAKGRVFCFPAVQSSAYCVHTQRAPQRLSAGAFGAAGGPGARTSSRSKGRLD